MMPNRIIRESCRTSPTLAVLSHGAERFFWRLTTVADDFGRFDADPMVLLGQCFTKMLNQVKVKDIAGWLADVRRCDLVRTYVSNGKTYGFFTTWETHQIKRARTSKYPAPTSASICSQPLANVSESSDTPRSEKRDCEESPATNRASGGAAHASNGFQVNSEILTALAQAPSFATVTLLRTPRFWQAQVRARPEVDFAKEILKAESWLASHPERRPKRPAQFLSNWFSRAEE